MKFPSSSLVRLGGRFHRTLAIAWMAALVTLLTTPGAALASDSAAVIGAVDPEVGFPELEDAWRTRGIMVGRSELDKVIPGLTKEQVANLFGRPHFDEGSFRVRVWNYIMQFRTGNGFETVVCQYQLHFNADYRVSRTYWDRDECARQGRGRTDEEVAGSPSVAGLEPRSHAVLERESTLEPAPRLEAEPAPDRSFVTTRVLINTLFEFDQSDRTGMLPGGLQVLDRLIDEVRGEAIERVEVNGYADRLGGEAYNRLLSQARAETVRTYLIERGVLPATIVANGNGQASPPSRSCEGKPRSLLIDCLGVDRRVEVTVRTVMRASSRFEVRRHDSHGEAEADRASGL